MHWERAVLGLYFAFAVPEGELYVALEQACLDNGDRGRADFWTARRKPVLGEGITMVEAGTVDAAVRGSWHALVLQGLKNSLAARPWSRDILLRGSLARAAEDFESDLDLVVTVAEEEFEAALHDCPARSRGLCKAGSRHGSTGSSGFRRKGFVYLVQVDEKNGVRSTYICFPKAVNSGCSTTNCSVAPSRQ